MRAPNLAKHCPERVLADHTAALSYCVCVLFFLCFLSEGVICQYGTQGLHCSILNLELPNCEKIDHMRNDHNRSLLL